VSLCFAPLRQLRHLCRYVTDNCFRLLVVSPIHSRLDYGNFVLVGLPAYLVQQLQSVLNAAARLVFHRRSCNSALVEISTTIRLQGRGHGVPSIAWSDPPYLDQLVRVADLPGYHHLRLSTFYQLHILAHRLVSAGRHLFPVAAAILCNSVPSDVQSATSLSVFQQRLKTFLFHQSYPDVLF